MPLGCFDGKNNDCVHRQGSVLREHVTPLGPSTKHSSQEVKTGWCFVLTEKKKKKKKKEAAANAEAGGPSRLSASSSSSSDSDSSSTSSGSSSSDSSDSESGEAQSGDTPVLPAGKYTYPFQYQLPSAGLPTSFECGYGYVRYFAEAIIDRPWKFDKKTKRAFTVLDMYDLNEDPNAMTPSAAQDSKKLGFWPFASDPIELQVQTDRGAYCPGEMVRLSGTLKNGSGTEIKETTVQLRQKATCVATSPHRDRRRQHKTLSEIKALGCKAKDATDLSSIALPIPAIPPSSQRYCNIIDVEYKVKFIVNIPGLHTNLDVEMPITIGSIPLKSYYPQAPSFPLHPVEQPPPSHESLYPDLGFAQWTYQAATDPSAPPPPYFAVSTEGPVALAEDKEDKYTMGPTEYAPKYAYYDWSKHA
ncbi:arrestin domain-containing protein 2-like isoform X2 [Branchiostoma floridae x Branchiostoma japonicum]